MLQRHKMFAWIVLTAAITVLGLFDPGKPIVLAQQPTGSIATVTGTPEGPVVTVDQSIPVIRVFAGPSSFDYPPIGVLLGNERGQLVGCASPRGAPQDRQQASPSGLAAPQYSHVRRASFSESA